MNSNKEAVKRLFVGGLSESITEKDIQDRFKPFGTIQSLDLSTRQSVTGSRFAHVTLSTSLHSFGKLISIYHGTKWKGCELRIEEAKQDYETRLKREWHETSLLVEKPFRISKKKLRKRAVQTAEDMNPIKDSIPKEWKQVGFGRHLPCMKFRNPLTRRIMTVDPSNFKSNHKLFEPSADNERLKQSKYNPGYIFYDDVETSKNLDLEDIQVSPERLETARKRRGSWTEQERQFVPPKTRKKKKKESAELLLKDRDLSKMDPQRKLRYERRSLLSIAETLFEDDDDDEDANANIVSNGAALDNTDAVVSFLSDDDPMDSVDHSLQIQSFDFSDSEKADGLMTATRQSSPGLFEAAQFNSSSSSDSGDPVKTVATTNYQVNTDLRSLVFGESTQQLFSFTVDEPEQDNTPESTPALTDFCAAANNEQKDCSSEPIVSIGFGTSKYFFFHFNEPALESRSFASTISSAKGTAFRRINSLEDINKRWEEYKEELTFEFKKKFKYSSRRRSKLIQKSK